MIKLELSAIEATEILIALEHRQHGIHERLAANAGLGTEALRMESDDIFDLHAKIQQAGELEGFKL